MAAAAVAAMHLQHQQQQMQAAQKFAVMAQQQQQQQLMQQQQQNAPQKPGQRSAVAMQRAMNNSARAAQAGITPAASPADGLLYGKHRSKKGGKRHHSSDDESSSDDDNGGADYTAQQPFVVIPPLMGGDDGDNNGSGSDEEGSDEDDYSSDEGEVQPSMALPPQQLQQQQQQFAASAAAPTAEGATAPVEESVDATRAAEGNSGGHSHNPSYPHHTVELIGCLKLPRTHAEAAHFHTEGMRLEGDANFDSIHMSLKNGLLVLGGNNSPAEILQMIREGNFYITNAKITEIQNCTDQIFDVSLTTGHGGDHRHITLLQGGCKSDATIYSAPFDPSTKATIDAIGILDVGAVKQHSTIIEDRVFVKRTGEAERAAKIIAAVYKNINGIELGSESDLSYVLRRKDFDEVIAEFEEWKNGVSLPIAHDKLGVKVHRRSIYERTDQNATERWISDLDRSHTNCLSFILELTVVSGIEAAAVVLAE